MDCLKTVDFCKYWDFLICFDKCPYLLQVLGWKYSWDANEIKFVFQCDILNVEYVIMFEQGHILKPRARYLHFGVLCDEASVQEFDLYHFTLNLKHLGLDLAICKINFIATTKNFAKVWVVNLDLVFCAFQVSGVT